MHNLGNYLNRQDRKGFKTSLPDSVSQWPSNPRDLCVNWNKPLIAPKCLIA